MNATATRVTTTSELSIPLLHFRNRTARRGLLWDGTLGAFFGQHHAIRDEPRGAPAFSFALGEPEFAVRSFTALVLAFDLEPDAAFAHADFLAGRSFVLFTAFDHRAGGDGTYRYRVVLPLSRPVDAHDYRVLAVSFDGELGGLADPGLERKDRRWPVPICPPQRAHHATIRYGNGPVLDVNELLGTRVSTGPRRLA
jgi:hypothetical protein